MDFILFCLEKRELLLFTTLRHIEVSAIAVVISVVVTVPLGILITRWRKLAHVVVNSANVGQTIPSLAILGLVIPVLGIGLKPAVFAIVIRGARTDLNSL